MVAPFLQHGVSPRSETSRRRVVAPFLNLALRAEPSDALRSVDNSHRRYRQVNWEQPCENRHSSSTFPMFVPSGKMIVFVYKWRKKWCFSHLVLAPMPCHVETNDDLFKSAFQFLMFVPSLSWQSIVLM